MKTKNILIVGVGGQGTLLTGRVIGGYALDNGYDVKMSEVHGMAQRGGSVVMQVKYGEEVYSPLVEPGEADVIFAFEKLEALRYIHFLKEDGVLISNTQSIAPMPVAMGDVEYPKNIEDKLVEICPNAHLINALDIAKEIGNVKVVNMIMIGTYAAYIKEDVAMWEGIIEKIVPPHTIEQNKRALREGYRLYNEK